MGSTEDGQGVTARVSDDHKDNQAHDAVVQPSGVNPAYALEMQQLWHAIKPFVWFTLWMLILIWFVTPYISGTWYGYTIVYGSYVSFVMYLMYRKV